jgi:uncharacterized LabA/DUF88 family protein
MWPVLKPSCPLSWEHGGSMNENPDTLLIVDQDERYRKAQARGNELDSEREAWLFNMYANVFGSHSRKVAIISVHDPKALMAYQQNGFETWAVNGNRPMELAQLIREESEWMGRHEPDSLILVTSDPAFAPMGWQASKMANTKLHIWADPTDLPKALLELPGKVRDLQALLPSQNRLNILLDYENLYISSKKLGPNLGDRILDAVHQALKGKGEIVQTLAYADWDALQQGLSTNLQRDLVRKGVETQYLIGNHGKNAADMRMVNDGRSQIEHWLNNLSQSNVLVLGTGDRDFCDLANIARKRGIRVIILSFRWSISTALRELATEVYFLEDYFGIPTVKPELTSSNCVPFDYAALVMEVGEWMKSKNFHWAFEHEMFDELGWNVDKAKRFEHLVDAGTYYSGKRWSKKAGREMAYFSVNYANGLYRKVESFSEWIHKKIASGFDARGMTPTARQCLAYLMLDNIELRRTGLGQTIEEAKAWIEAACSAGLLG